MLQIYICLILFLSKMTGATNTPLPKEIFCPVMVTNAVNVARATTRHQYADYKGRRYFFCCPACPTAFKNNPEKFASGPSIPIPK